MKIKLLNSGGYQHKAGLEFPVTVCDPKAVELGNFVMISESVLKSTGFKQVSGSGKIAFCLAGHKLGCEAIIL